MSKTYNQLYFCSLEYVQKFKDTLSKKKLQKNLQKKYQLTEEQAKEMVDNYE
jgi:hypothetical protein